MFASEMIGKSPVLRARDDDPADITLADGANVAVISDSSVEFYLMFDPVRGIRRRRLNACPGPRPGLGEWRGAVAFIVLSSIRSPCGGQAFVVPV